MNTTPTPALTPYDTGDRLEPHSWTGRNQAETNFEDYGKVDFDTEEGATVLTVHAAPDEWGRDERGYTGYTLHIGNVGVDHMTVKGDETLPVIKVPSQMLLESVRQVIDDLRTPTEREEAEIYWNDDEALILVPEESHVREEQLILVNEGGITSSAKVSSSNWRVGVQDTRIG